MTIRRDLDNHAKSPTRPTCLARLCAYFGLDVPSDVTKFGRLPARAQLALREKTGWLVELTMHGDSCTSNHVRLYRQEAWPSMEVRSYEDVIDDCPCGNQLLTIMILNLRDLMICPANDYFLYVDFYSSTDLEKKLDVMDKYHDYLRKNYSGGVDRFFSPTGALEAFQVGVEVALADTRNHVYARNMDEAVSHLEPVLDGSEGVFDLTSEPGTGKTSVFPFKFPSKLVAVVLPTPFDAWSAYNMATGRCKLHIKGLKLGPARARVTYMDSYRACELLLTDTMKEDFVIVDECDSGKGVTAFLAEIRARGKILVRMSASHGRVTNAASSKSFTVTESADMPDIRAGVGPVAEFVRARAVGRSVVLTPDAQSASEMANRIGGVLLSSGVGLRAVASAMFNTDEAVVYVADDVCARGINLNLDAMFDCMLVTEYGATRSVTAAEWYQRKGRVGRNKPGWYYSPGLDLSTVSGLTQLDMVRHNVVRSVAGLRQLGAMSLRVECSRALELLTAAREPYLMLSESRITELSDGSSSNTGSKSRRSSISSGRGSSAGPSSPSRTTAVLPKWVAYFSNATSPGLSARTAGGREAVVNKTSRGLEVVVRRRSGEGPPRREVSHQSVARRAELPLSSGPYCAPPLHVGGVIRRAPEVMCAPPLMNLTEMPYDMDWPELVRQSFCCGRDLPTLVPPDGWRHTSSGGMEIDWVSELDRLSRTEHGFTLTEFEVVARAWNKLVAREWVRRTPGLRTDIDSFRMEFCVRYFQASFLNWSAA